MATQPAQARSPLASIPRPQVAHLLNLPNSLTLIRISMVPVFLAMISRHHYTHALYVFGAAAVTDSLDGTVARWFDAKTELGAFLDPFADKLMLVSAFITLTIAGNFPPWVLGIVLIRDVVIVTGYFMLVFFTGDRIPVRPSYLGKASTFFQLAAVVAALARMDASMPHEFNYLLYAAAAVTSGSGLHYVYRGLLWLFYREPEMFE